jgi:FkbM family methyltransferase
MQSWRQAVPLIAGQLRRYPPLFDLCRRMTRRIGWSGPVDRALRELLAPYDELRFIQVGTNDGITRDPFREFVIRRPRWRGIFVEPLRDLLERCRWNYSFYMPDRFVFVQAAVSDQSGTISLWRIKEGNSHRFPSTVSQISSADPAHLLKHFPGLDISTEAEEVEIECLTLADLMQSARFAELDVLILDVEGHEPQILRTLDTLLARPKIVLFERSHLSEEQVSEIGGLMRRLGYTVRSSGVDSLATLDTEVDPSHPIFHEFD